MNYNIEKNTYLYPLTFEPILKNYIWGGNNLEQFYGTLPYDKVAESWQASCHPNGESKISNGFLKGKKLIDAIKCYGSSLVGIQFEGKIFPILAKIIDANQNLSVQVHPSDEYAKIHENDTGKNEMWYILSAKPSAYIYYGLAKGVVREAFIKSVEQGTVEACLNKMEVKTGDVVYIPAGTVHAICEGIMIIEIQQNSDATYRVFDYNRKDENGNPARPLHIKQAIDVINFDKTQNKKQKGFKLQIEQQSYKTILTANKYFSAELWEVNELLEMESDINKFEIFIIIENSMKINYQIGEIIVNQGYSVLIPAQLGKYSVKGNFKAIKAYVPDLEKDIYEPLITQGFDRNYIHECIG